MKETYKKLSSTVRRWKKGASRRHHYSVSALVSNLKEAGFKAAPLNKAERELYSGTCKFARVIIGNRVLYVARNGGTGRLIRASLETGIVGFYEAAGSMSRRSKDKCAGYRLCREAYLAGLVLAHKAIFARIGAPEEIILPESKEKHLHSAETCPNAENTTTPATMTNFEIATTESENFVVAVAAGQGEQFLTTLRAELIVNNMEEKDVAEVITLLTLETQTATLRVGLHRLKVTRSPLKIESVGFGEGRVYCFYRCPESPALQSRELRRLAKEICAGE